MKKGMIKKLIFLILIMFIIVWAYRVIVKEKILETDLEHKMQVEEINLTQESIQAKPEICTAGWTCADNKTRVFYSENCTEVNTQECSLGCVNDSCIIETCEHGFKCKGAHVRALQTEECQWISKTKCEFGCEEGECLPEPNETTTTEKEEEETTTPRVINMLKQGDINIVNVAGGEHNLSIYILEETRVRMLLDDRKSDWITEGANFTYGGDVPAMITITAIYFQSYADGMRAVSYEIE